MKLADKFKILSPHQNAQIVDYIQAICPTAFREQGDKVQVLVDNMDIITFKQLLEYLYTELEKLRKSRWVGCLFQAKRSKWNDILIQNNCVNNPIKPYGNLIIYTSQLSVSPQYFFVQHLSP
jgi:hypothetical protein